MSFSWGDLGNLLIVALFLAAAAGMSVSRRAGREHGRDLRSLMTNLEGATEEQEQLYRNLEDLRNEYARRLEQLSGKTSIARLENVTATFTAAGQPKPERTLRWGDIEEFQRIQSRWPRPDHVGWESPGHAGVDFDD